MAKAELGTISWGTMRSQDLIPKFAAELRRISDRQPDMTLADESEIALAHAIETRSDDVWDDCEEHVASLFDALDKHALPWTYFGSHPGDGSDYGFWVIEDIENQFDGLQVDNLDDVPADYEGQVLEFAAYMGVARLYNVSNGKHEEIWSI